MDWQVSKAKNGEYTLQLNSIQIYSKYRPFEDASKFINAEYDTTADNYLLIGLGLGYHLKALMQLEQKKNIIVYYFSEEELKLFNHYNEDVYWERENLHLVNNIRNLNISEKTQVILNTALLKAIGQDHSLFTILEVIKINQLSYKSNSSLLEGNFYLNTSLNHLSIKKEERSKVACLVAAGPSLNTTVRWLKDCQNQVDIYVVGAALKSLIAKDISPKAVVLSDANDVTLEQFIDAHFTGELYYLSTASHESVKNHQGQHFILYQKGYRLAEDKAKELKVPLIETGGSVGTTTFSLIEQLGYQKIVLFGQDLGFSGEYTHAEFSPSKRKVVNDLFLRKEVANDGSEIYTTPMLHVFKFWYNQKMMTSTAKVYNTALKGAKIKNVPLITEQQFQLLINGEVI